MIIIIFKLPNVILTTREKDSSIPGQIIVFEVTFVNLIIVENLATDAVQEISSSLELPCVHLV